MSEDKLCTRCGNSFPVVIECDYLVHTNDLPFCDSARCDCHNLALNGQTFIETIEQPIRDGLLTTAEGLRLYWGEQI